MEIVQEIMSDQDKWEKYTIEGWVSSLANIGEIVREDIEGIELEFGWPVNMNMMDVFMPQKVRVTVEVYKGVEANGF